LVVLAKRTIMDHSELREKWPKVKEKIKDEHPELTESDLYYQIGREEELLERLQEKLKKNRKEIDNWLSLLG
jgi:hypothetical protein